MCAGAHLCGRQVLDQGLHLVTRFNGSALSQETDLFHQSTFVARAELMLRSHTCDELGVRQTYTPE